MSATEAKAHFSELLAQVAHGGEQVVIEKHGKPVAKLVGMGNVDETDQDEAGSKRPKGILSLAGLWADVPSEELDKLLADIYDARERDKGRPVDLDL
ncbi:MAG: type II toxin-antitoxin system Phd/YefM family antitoxin [Chloroflexi bacterium]|nr:type II toxin-antitoxin system Phd/YefM family antitoxin [Chloroflexota bacterium]